MDVVRSPVARLVVVLILSAMLSAQASPPGEADSFAHAQQLFKQGKFQEAAAAYRAILEKDKSSARAYSGLVQSYLKADDVPAADEAAAQALKAFPQSGVAQAVSGDVSFRKGLLSEAEAHYRAALQQDKNCARAWLGMGKIYTAVSRSDQAKEAFTKAHTLDPEDGDAWYHWAVLLPFPQSTDELEKQLSAFKSGAEEDQREREFIDLVKGIGNREIWAPSKNVNETEIKLDTVTPRPGVVLGLGLHVKFNGSSSSLLLLDTGSTWITIPRKLAEKIGARKIADYGIEGIGDSGRAAGYFAWVDKITIGDVEFHDCVVHVSARSDMEGIDGLAGTDIFDKYLVTLDFPARKLRVSPLPATTTAPGETLVHSFEGKADAQVLVFGHILLMNARVNHSASGLFVLDTGANTSSITPDFARAAGKPHETAERVSGSSGAVNKVFVLEDAALQFAASPEPGSTLIAFDRRSLSRQLGTEVSGAIGFASLNKMKVSINYRDGVVSFEGAK